METEKIKTDIFSHLGSFNSGYNYVQVFLFCVPDMTQKLFELVQ